MRLVRWILISDPNGVTYETARASGGVLNPMTTYWKRRLGRHAVFGVTGAMVLLGGVHLFQRRDVIWRVSVVSAWACLILLVVSLVLGPWNVLRRRPNPVSFDLRRDVGIWAVVMALVHTAFGVGVHMRGRPWLYFLFEDPARHLIPLRYDAWGVANWLGAAATGVAIVLGAVSNDAAVRALGVTRWKALQRFNYLLFALTVAHTAIYQLRIERRPASIVAVVCVLVAATTILQIAGVRRVVQARASSRRGER